MPKPRRFGRRRADCAPDHGTGLFSLEPDFFPSIQAIFCHDGCFMLTDTQSETLAALLEASWGLRTANGRPDDRCGENFSCTL